MQHRMDRSNQQNILEEENKTRYHQENENMSSYILLISPIIWFETGGTHNSSCSLILLEGDLGEGLVQEFMTMD